MGDVRKRGATMSEAMDPNACPTCGSHDFAEEYLWPRENLTDYKRTCDGCGAVWTIVNGWPEVESEGAVCVMSEVIGLAVLAIVLLGPVGPVLMALPAACLHAIRAIGRAL